MAQSSTTITAQRSHKANITVSNGLNFSSTSGTNTISTTATSLSNLAQFDLITITGTTNNNSTFTVKSVATDGLSITVEETVTNESRDGSTASTIDYTGFVTDKHKGDGYYSQTDGVHTVAYHVESTCTGSIKMQGTLSTTPTETDWFDISSTTFTTDQSTLVSSSTFTGNFVWVRAKATGITAGSVSKILFNR